MEDRQFWFKDNWTNPDISYLKSNRITEFDLTAAASNIMVETGIISEETYSKMMSLPKMEREVMVGKAQINNPEAVRKLTEGYRAARRMFIENNNLTEMNVLGTKRDAIYVIGNTSMINGYITDRLIFRPKNVYQGYLRYGKKEHYLKDDFSGIEVKGYTSVAKENNENGWFKFIFNIMNKDRLPNGDESIYYDIASLKYKLATGSADKEFYRDINTGEVNYRTDMFTYSTSNPETEVLDMVDLTENINFLIYLVKAVLV